MFSFIELGRLHQLPHINIDGLDSIEPGTIGDVEAPEWHFDDPMMDAQYEAIRDAKRFPCPFHHMLIMAAPHPLFITNGKAVMVLKLAIAETPTGPSREFPHIEPSLESMEKDELAHIVNLNMASKNNRGTLGARILEREMLPVPAHRVRPSGKSRKPSSTVSKPGCIYNKTWEFAAIKWNGKEFISPNKASVLTCHDRIVADLMKVDERYIIPSKDEELTGFGHHDVAVRCDHCDKVHHIRETIKLTPDTMTMFPELQDACDILGL